MTDAILKFEKNSNWQATARLSSEGKMVAIMRGQPGGKFEGNFYLYDEDWKPIAGSPFPELEGMQPYSAQEIRDKFASNELILMKGQPPEGSRNEMEHTFESLRNDIAAREREIEILEQQGYDWLKKAEASGDLKAKADLEKIARDVQARIIELRQALSDRKRELQSTIRSTQNSD